MTNDLATLQTQGSKLLEEFLGLGDLRPGFHYRHHPTLRQVFLPLRQSQRPWT
jgi:hypothetical protein